MEAKNVYYKNDHSWFLWSDRRASASSAIIADRIILDSGGFITFYVKPERHISMRLVKACHHVKRDKLFYVKHL